MPKAPIPTEFEGHRVVLAAQMAEIDRKAIQDRKIPALELMENAGQGVARETAILLGQGGKSVKGALVVACCGRGNNGGDGLVAARALRKLGADVRAHLIAPKADAGYGPEIQENLHRAQEAGVTVRAFSDEAVAELDADLAQADVVLDALLGTGSAGKPAGPVRLMIQRMNKAGKPIVSVDIPSGVHPDTGYHSGVFVTAALTLTLGLPKRGLVTPHAQKNVGVLKVLDIGFPKELLK